MSKFGSKEEIIAAVQAHFENIGSGKLTADEMESLVELTRELHERALILRYKSYEEKIFGKRPQPQPIEAEAAPEEKPETAAEAQPEPVKETTPAPEHAISFEQAEEEILEAEPASQPEEPVFDFDMFEKAEAEADIFTPAFEPQPAAEVKPAVTEPKETPTQPEIPLPEELAIINEPVITPEAPKADLFEAAEKAAAPEPVQEAPAKPEMPLPEELAIMNEPVVVPEQPVQKEEQTDIFKRYSNTDDSLSSRLMSSKLHTLVGAFGLNDKLQCIRELFKGSSEAFNQAIETLDQQENFAAAKRVLAQYAQQNSWDLESNLTAEFIQKVERRFL